MADAALRGRRILVAEDEYLLAVELCDDLASRGAVVVGPVATVAQAMALLDTGVAIDGALVDVNLRGQRIFPVADRLLARGVATMLTTGYDEGDITPRYAALPRCTKPVDMKLVLRVLGCPAPA